MIDLLTISLVKLNRPPPTPEGICVCNKAVLPLFYMPQGLDPNAHVCDEKKRC